jgi:hypothetical protein
MEVAPLAAHRHLRYCGGPWRFEMSELGPIFTGGTSYRARAEARQREYRARALGIGHAKYGHLLAESDADEGRNFLVAEAFEAARARQRAGKGVGERTFNNMLSSQAMCFNVFAPLSSRLDLATRALQPFISGLAAVKSIEIEHTPAPDVFNDQSGRGGVDCDLLVEGTNARGQGLVAVVETKFVEPEFSACGFRKPGRAARGQDVCPEEVPVRDRRDACLYARKKGYAYWQRSDQYRLLGKDALPETGCPFAGPRWQLWANLALAHEEASRRGAVDVRFAVCVSANNATLLDAGGVLDGFRSLLTHPDTVQLIDLEMLLAHLEGIVPPELSAWADSLSARYRGI